MVNGVLDAPSVNLGPRARRCAAPASNPSASRSRWDLVEPARGQFEWAAIDRKAAAHNRIDVLGFVVRTPNWAASEPGQPFSPPRDPATYAAFLRTLVGR